MNSKKRSHVFYLAVLFGLLLCPAITNAQYATLDWANRFGGSGASLNDFANGIAVDSSGNAYVIGQFMGTIDFDPGAGTANRTAAGNQDVFICKFDSSGVFQWAITMGAAGSDYGNGIAVDTSGNVYATGQFQNTVDFDPGAGTSNLVATAIEMFVAKYDASGAFQWAATSGGALNDRGRGVTVDGSGNVYAVGEDQETGVSQDVLIVKYNSSGVVLWSSKVGSTQSDVPYGVSLNAAGTQLYVTGQFNGTVDFDPGAGAASRTSAGGTDIFILNLDSSGAFGWAQTMGSTGGDVGYGVVVDSAGSVLTTGYFNGTVDFDPGAGTANFTVGGATDLFVLKLNSSGNYVWANAIGGTGGEIGQGIAVDGSNNAYIAGQFSNVSGLCPYTLTSAGGTDILLAKMTSAGVLVSLNSMGGRTTRTAGG